jgi:hypothetical protein
MNRKNCENPYSPGWTFLIAFFSIAVLLCSGGILQATAISGNLEADISVKDRPLKEVVNLVQEQTGYRIELKSIDESFPVTGSYSDTEVEKIFIHLLKGHNISVTINTTDKLISVISLGGKKQIANDSQKLETIPPVAAEVKEPEPIPSVASEVNSISLTKSASDQTLELTGLSNQEVQDLQTQQAKEFEQQQSDPNTVDPLTGLTLTALEDMHKTQIMESNQKIK